MKGLGFAAAKASILASVAKKFVARSRNGALPITQECDTVPCHRLELIRLVANSPIVRDGKPAFRAHSFEPLLVGAIRREQLAVPDNGQAGIAQNVGELLSEVSIREERPAHAARS